MGWFLLWHCFDCRRSWDFSLIFISWKRNKFFSSPSRYSRLVLRFELEISAVKRDTLRLEQIQKIIVHLLREFPSSSNRENKGDSWLCITLLSKLLELKQWSYKSSFSYSFTFFKELMLHLGLFRIPMEIFERYLNILMWSFNFHAKNSLGLSKFIRMKIQVS